MFFRLLLLTVFLFACGAPGRTYGENEIQRPPPGAQLLIVNNAPVKVTNVLAWTQELRMHPGGFLSEKSEAGLPEGEQIYCVLPEDWPFGKQLPLIVKARDSQGRRLIATRAIPVKSPEDFFTWVIREADFYADASPPVANDSP